MTSTQTATALSPAELLAATTTWLRLFARPHLHVDASPLHASACYGVAGWSRDGLWEASTEAEIAVRISAWVTAAEHEDGWLVQSYSRVDRVDDYGTNDDSRAWPLAEGEADPVLVATRTEAEQVVAAALLHISEAVTREYPDIDLPALAASLGIDLLEIED